MSITVTAFLTAALAEIRSARAGDVVNPDDMDLALTIFNEQLDALNAEDRALYTTAFPNFTLTPSLQPHTIGISANTPTFTVTIGRPVLIEGASIVISNSIRVPLTIRDAEWWGYLRAPAITAALSTDLYYAPSWPNGSIYLWPVPLTAYGLELQTKTLLASVALADTLDLPFGYQQALRLTLAELLAPSFGQKVSDSTALKAREARGRVWGDNDRIPNVIPDGGVPCGARGGGYNYLTGDIA